MENNPVSPLQPTPEPVVSSTASQQPTVLPATAIPVVPQQSEGGDSKKVIFMLLIGLIIIAVTVGAVYFYLNSQQSKAPVVQVTPKEPVVQKAATSNSDVAGVSTIEADLSSVNVPTLNGAFDEIDKDLSSL